MANSTMWNWQNNYLTLRSSARVERQFDHTLGEKSDGKVNSGLFTDDFMTTEIDQR